MDIWGPFRVPTYIGERYFLTIVDDFSKGTWAYLMHSKQDTLDIIKKFSALVNTQFNSCIKATRTDNASDFFKTKCTLLLSSLGIIHQSSCPYTPQQNGVVERKNRHILEITRSLRFQAFLPLKIWDDCVLTAVYLINRTPTPLLRNHTPFESSFLKPPLFDHLRVFGCLCYITSLVPKHKIFPTSTSLCLLGIF